MTERGMTLEETRQLVMMFVTENFLQACFITPRSPLGEGLETILYDQAIRYILDKDYDPNKINFMADQLDLDVRLEEELGHIIAALEDLMPSLCEILGRNVAHQRLGVLKGHYQALLRS